MTLIRWVLVYCAAVLLHWWWTAHLTVLGVSPNILLVISMCAAALCGPFAAHAFAFFSGMYLDLMGTELFGGYAFVFTVLAYAVNWFRRHMDVVSPFSQAIMVWVMSIGGILIYQFVSVLFIHHPARMGIGFIFIEPAFNAALAPVIFVILKTLRKGHPQQPHS